MNVQKVSNDVRLNEWMNVVKECRESGLPVSTWCEQNDIRTQSYYYWLKKIRTLACESVSSETSANPFVPVPINSETTKSYSNCVATLHKGDVRIEIFNDISFQLLNELLKAL